MTKARELSELADTITVDGSGNLDVTGTVTSDGLAVDETSNLNGFVDILSSTNISGTDVYDEVLRLDNHGARGVGSGIGISFYQNADERSRISAEYDVSGQGLHFYTRPDGVAIRERLTVNGIGDISFYEDTGTTPKFFWDASAESLGIGTSSPSYPLHVKSSATTTAVFDAGSDGYDVQLRMEQNGAFVGAVGYDDDLDAVYLNRYGNATQGLTVVSGGNVGIGTSSPTARLDVAESSGIAARLRRITSGNNIDINFYNPIGTAGDIARIRVDGDSISNIYGALSFWTTQTPDSLTERMRITSAGDVGIGTSSPSNYGGYTTISLNGTTGGNYELFDSGTLVGQFYNASGRVTLRSNASGSDLTFETNENYERMRIDSSGNVGIGTSSPEAVLHLGGSSNQTIQVEGASNTAYFGTNGDRGDIFVNYDPTDGTIPNSGRSVAGIQLDGADGGSNIRFRTAGANNAASGERMRIDSSGQVGIGTSSPSAPLHVYRSNTSGITEALRLETGGSGTGCKLIFKTPDNGSLDKYIMQSGYWTEIGVHNNEGLRMRNSSGNIRFQVSGLDGNCTISGSLSKGSGSFRIDHPLPEKTETHDLVHSFIEGPQADLIYRGRVVLVDGQAQVNIDLASDMTDGTFVVLCRDVQCFTSNETGWTAVRGSVSGNILTIEAQDNTCTDTISWMVVGERQDKHMFDTSWTDENGKIIVEPLKITEAEQLANSIAYHESGAQ